MEICEKLITTRSIKDGQVISSETEGVRFVVPDPCVFNQTWFAANPGNIKLIPDVKIERENLRFNRIYRVISPNNVDYYIFPKEIGDVIDILLKKPFQSVLLYGAPGTGKTSIVEILSKYYGFTTIWIRPYSSLSKFVGESERKLEELFIKAESEQP